MLRLNSLKKNSKSNSLEPRAMELLVYLDEHTEDVVSKEQLIQDAESASGYRLDIAPFPGWETVPRW